MRKHVTPADPAASVPDPDRRDVLPRDGREVVWSPYWARRAARGEVTVTDLAEVAAPEPPPAEAGADTDHPTAA